MLQIAHPTFLSWTLPAIEGKQVRMAHVRPAYENVSLHGDVFTQVSSPLAPSCCLLFCCLLPSLYSLLPSNLVPAAFCLSPCCLLFYSLLPYGFAPFPLTLHSCLLLIAVCPLGFCSAPLHCPVFTGRDVA